MLTLSNIFLSITHLSIALEFLPSRIFSFFSACNSSVLKFEVTRYPEMEREDGGQHQVFRGCISQNGNFNNENLNAVWIKMGKKNALIPDLLEFERFAHMSVRCQMEWAQMLHQFDSSLVWDKRTSKKGKTPLVINKHHI